MHHDQRAWASEEIVLRPIGIIRSPIVNRVDAPKQGYEGAPDVWLELDPSFSEALDGVSVGQDLILITWLNRGKRDVLKAHPRSDPSRPLTGVFALRSPDRPNPLGLHRVTLRAIEENRLRIGPLEAIDGTPVVDLKPVLSAVDDA